jgi:hypothetical protein
VAKAVPTRGAHGARSSCCRHKRDRARQALVQGQGCPWSLPSLLLTEVATRRRAMSPWALAGLLNIDHVSLWSPGCRTTGMG